MDIHEKIQNLLEKTRELVDEHADQVILVETVQGNVYYFANTCVSQSRDEDQFLAMLVEKNDVQIHYMVCMWNSFETDVPHIRFRKRLLELCSENGETDILLMGEGYYVTRKLSLTMPCQ